MGDYFGTDGVRGVANKDLTVEMAYKIGRYLGHYFKDQDNCRFVVGKDTRLSSTMLESALISGCLESGADVYALGYTSTPSVSYLVKNEAFIAGVMISASHNPYYDNGIKILKNDGTKITAELEALIEDYFINEQDIPRAAFDKIGRFYDFQDGLNDYGDYLLSLKAADYNSLKIALDLANGSACFTAKRLFSSLGLKVDYFNDQPDGININNKCGSTHLKGLREIVKNHDYDAGFAYDGDADRVLAIAHDGSIIDGDAIMFIVAKYLSSIKRLKDETLVTTVMSNIGLHKALKKAGLKTAITQVGDKYVYECMQNNAYSLGGEQSGHIIFADYANSGDGLLTSLFLLNIMAKEKKGLKELSEELVIYPQLLINIKVKDKIIIEDQEVKDLINEVSQLLGDNGRILVRTSGTEPLIRVMVEAENDELCQKYCQKVADLLKEKDT